MIPKFNRKIVERGKIDILSTQIHEQSLSWLGTGTSMKSGRVKLYIYGQKKNQKKTHRYLYQVHCTLRNMDDTVIGNDILILHISLYIVER